MKTLLITLVVFVLCSTNVLALDPLGPPTAGLNQGQYSTGMEYLSGETDVKISGLGTANVKMDKVYSNSGYGLSKDCEVFLRVGTANVEFGDVDGDSSVLGGGIKATFFESGKERWGILAQISRTDNIDLDMGISYLTAEADITEIQIAFGPEYQLSEAVSIYGGPFFHFVDGDLDMEHPLIGKLSFGIEQDSMFGGYIGTEIELTKNIDYNIEVQAIGGEYTIATGLVWKF